MRTGDFLPSETFNGQVVGAEFKRGPRGMGYYRTQEAKERLAAVEAMVVLVVLGVVVVTISWDDPLPSKASFFTFIEKA